MNTYIALSSLSMDLKRVALGYFHGSDKMAEQFYQEAIKRKQEIDQSKLAPYLVKLLHKIEQLQKEADKMKIAEDALMYSTLFQNAALKYKNSL